ncbi:MAG: phospholipid-binding protein MlaC [Syntrophobacteraceae bacterium]
MYCRVHKGYFLSTLTIFVLLVLCLEWSIAAAPGGPMAVIQSGTERALKTLRETQRGEGPTLRQRKGEILTIVDEYFNFEEMARRALGRPWKSQSPEKRNEFVGLFKQLLFNTYISRVEGYTGSNEKVFYDSEKLDGDYAVVTTHIIYQGNKNVVIDYRLRREGGLWKVYDVVVEGISFVENYRGQFSSILANESFDALLKKIREKIQQQQS